MNNLLGLYNGNIVELNNQDILTNFNSSYAYEVVRLIYARPLFLDLHYKRLIKTCSSLKIYAPKKEEIVRNIELLIKENQLLNINIKIAADRNNYAIFPILSKYPSQDDYLRGVPCSLLFEERKNPEIKAFQKELREKSNEQISQHEIYESVLVNSDGIITEGSRSNLFFIKKSEVYTAPKHMVLPGITRLKVIDLCKAMKISIFEDPISTEELKHIDAAFIAGTSPGVLPINRIENVEFDVQNPILRKIHQSYHSKYLSNK